MHACKASDNYNMPILDENTMIKFGSMVRMSVGGVNCGEINKLE